MTNTWEEQYHWITKSSYIGADGQPHTRTKHHYKNVPYSETLSAVLTLNTKQGITESTWESRGSWEIIPWAKKNGLDPNEVTRSGYGIEVKAETTYTTDWEKDPPGTAGRKGGTYKGPDKVTADFYDPKAGIRRIDLVPTKGKPGDKKITWELPIQKHPYSDGNSVNHMTLHQTGRSRRRSHNIRGGKVRSLPDQRNAQSFSA